MRKSQAENSSSWREPDFSKKPGLMALFPQALVQLQLTRRKSLRGFVL
jgi:hypothetical protein